MYKPLNPVFVLLFSISIAINANTIYVATNGSNANSGTLSAPYKTITYAASQASPGDMVLVRGGTYTNASFGNGSIWNNENAAQIVANGTATQYITFKPYNDEYVIIHFDGTYGLLIKNSSYLKIMGFEVKGMSESITLADAWANWGIYKNPDDNTIHNLATELGIDPSDPGLIGQTIPKPAFSFNEIRPAYYNGRGIVFNASHHIEITNNMVHHCPQSGIRSEGCDYITVAQNLVYANTYYTSAGVGAITFSSNDHIDTNNEVKMIIDRNKVYNNENRLVSWNGSKDFITFEIDEGSGIFLTRNNDASVPQSEQYQYGYFLIRNNLCYQNGASGIVVHKTNRTIVENNTCYKNGNNNTGNPGGIGLNTVDDLTIRNNITYAKPDKFALGVVGLPANNVKVGHNIIFNENGTENVTNKMSATYITNFVLFSGGWLESNPLLIDPYGFDFHLMVASPAVNYGSNLTSATLDIDGNNRDSDPDAGAYEYNATVSIQDIVTDQIELYPIPTQDYLFVKGLNSKEFYIFSMEGKMMQESFKTTLVDEDTRMIDVSGLTSGLYYFKTTQGVIKFFKI